MFQRSRENSLSSELQKRGSHCQFRLPSLAIASRRLAEATKHSRETNVTAILKVDGKHKSKRRSTYIELVEYFLQALDYSDDWWSYVWTYIPRSSWILPLSGRTLGWSTPPIWVRDTRRKQHRFHLVPLHHIAAHLVTVQYQQVSGGRLRSTSHSRASSGGWWYSTVPALQATKHIFLLHCKFRRPTPNELPTYWHRLVFTGLGRP